MENLLIFFWIWGEAELFLGTWGAKANTVRETRTLFAGRRGDQCIIFRDQGSTDPPGGLIMESAPLSNSIQLFHTFLCNSQNSRCCG